MSLRNLSEAGSVAGYVIICVALVLLAFWWTIQAAMMQTVAEWFYTVIDDGALVVSAELYDSVTLLLTAFRIVPTAILIFIMIYGVLTALRERAEVV